MEMNVAARIKLEHQIVRKLIREAISVGWMPVSVNNGGDENETTPTESSMMEHAFACDEASLNFRKVIDDRGITCSVYIVLGNDGYDVIADYSDPDQRFSHGWNELMERINTYVSDLEEKAA